MTVFITTFVPIPPPKTKKPTKYPFSELKLGESFFVPNRKNPPENVEFGLTAHLSTIAQYVSRHNRLETAGKKKHFRYRIWPDNAQFIHVWRES